MIPGGHEKQFDVPLVLLGSGNQKLESWVIAGLPRPNRHVDPQTCLGTGGELKRAQPRQFILCRAECPDLFLAAVSSEELSQVLADDHIWLVFHHWSGPYSSG